MSATAITPSMSPEKASSRRQSLALMFLCTLLGAGGQVLIKWGAKTSEIPAPWTTPAGAMAHLWSMGTNFYLLAGYGLYAVMTVAFVFALKNEELSIVYPVISLTYVWVAALSVWLFGETVNAGKVLGVLIIVSGVAVLGRDGHK